MNINVDEWVSRFAIDTKVNGIVDSEEGCQRIQQDIDQLQICLEKSQMEFNLSKGEVLHIENLNVKGYYTVSGISLSNFLVQGGLGIKVHSFLKTATLVDKIVNVLYGTLSLVSLAPEYKSQELMFQLYRILMRLHLEYRAQFWLSICSKDVEALECIQKSFTTMLPGLARTWSYFLIAFCADVLFQQCFLLCLICV